MENHRKVFPAAEYEIRLAAISKKRKNLKVYDEYGLFCFKLKHKLTIFQQCS